MGEEGLEGADATSSFEWTENTKKKKQNWAISIVIKNVYKTKVHTYF